MVSNEEYFYEEIADRLARAYQKFEDANLLVVYFKVVFQFRLRNSEKFGKWKLILELPYYLQEELVSNLLREYRRNK